MVKFYGKIIKTALIIAITLISQSGWPQSHAEELERLEKTVKEAKKRIQEAHIYRWNDALRFMPSINIGRRAPYGEYLSEEKETFVSASINLGGLYDATELARKRKGERRKAAKKVEMNFYTIQKLIERKYLIKEQIEKMEKISKSSEDVLDVAAKMEKIENLKVKLNELCIEIDRKYYEIEEVVIGVEE